MNQPKDVEVILAPDRHYQFHSSVLVRNSTLLAELLTERSAAHLSTRAKSAGIKVRWVLALKAPDGEYTAGQLELVPLDTMGTPIYHASGLILNENGLIPTAPSLISNYQTILEAFYNRDLPISDTSISSALQHTVALVTIAEYLGCIPVISKPIDVALIKHGQAFWRSIQKMPWLWVGMALRIKSEMIFREAVVHLAGNWRKIEQNESAIQHLKEVEEPEKVQALCVRLHRSIVSKGKKLELALASLYPGGMATPSSQLPIKREEYAKDVLVWMALSFFRHWLGQQIICEKGSAGADGGFRLYSQLGKAGEAYMDKKIVDQFHHKFPMTKKALNILENHLLEIKECVKGVVDSHGMLVTKCMLDTKQFPVDYLTCVEVRKEDLPWVRKGEDVAGQTVAGLKRGLRPGGDAMLQRAQTGRDQEREEGASGMYGDDEEEEHGCAQEDEGQGAPGKRPRYA